MADRYIFGASSAPAAGANVRVQLAAADLALMAGFKRGTASVEIDGANGVIFTASSASNFTVTGADILIDTVTSGDLTLSSAHDLVVGIPNLNDAVDRLMTIYGTNRGAGRADLAIGFSHKIEIDSEDDSYFKATDAALTLATVTTGILTLEAGNAEAAANAVDINALYGGVTMDAASSISLDAATASNFTVTGSAESLALAVVGGGAQKLTLDSAGTGADSIDITSSVGGIQLTSALGVDIVGAATVSTTLGVTGACTFSGITATGITIQNANYGQFLAGADDGLILGIGDTSGNANRHLIFTSYANRAKDHDHDTQSDNPTIFGHSVRDSDESNTEWWSKTHDGSDAIYSVGHGGHTFTTAAQHSRGTITFPGGVPIADETFVLNVTTLTWKADGSGNVDHVTIGVNAAACVTNLVASIAECTESGNLTGWDGAGDTVVVEWGTGGVAGNAIVFTEACTNMTMDGAGTLGATHAGVAAATLFTIGEDKAVSVPGTLTATGLLTANGGINVGPNDALYANLTTMGGIYPWLSTQTVDAMFFATGTSGNYHLICENADIGFDFQVPQQTNPTLLIFSANQSLTEWISFAHDQTDAVINSGLGAVTLANGVLRVAETTTPGARANYGAFYTKNDNVFYVQDGDGVEHALRYADANLGEMWLNNNGNPTVIETAATPIMIRNYTTGDLANWTYHVGTTGGITVYADYSGTVAGTVLVTSAGHGLSTGDIISIRGAANYIGVYSITWVAAGTFYITAAWAGDDGASDWDQGDYLLAGAGAAGKYIEAWTLGLSEGGAAGSTVLVRAYKNATVCLKCTMPRKFANNDVGAMAGHSMMDIVEGDRVALTIQSSGTNDFTASWGNLSLHQL